MGFEIMLGVYERILFGMSGLVLGLFVYCELFNCYGGDLVFLAIDMLLVILL